MMIKVGRVAVINMKAIRSIHIIPHTKEVIEDAFWGKKKNKEESLAVVIYYVDSTDQETHFTLHGFNDVQSAEEVKNEVLCQIKELELESMSMTLENAIRNS